MKGRGTSMRGGSASTIPHGLPRGGARVRSPVPRRSLTQPEDIFQRVGRQGPASRNPSRREPFFVVRTCVVDREKRRDYTGCRVRRSPAQPQSIVPVPNGIPSKTGPKDLRGSRCRPAAVQAFRTLAGRGGRGPGQGTGRKGPVPGGNPTGFDFPLPVASRTKGVGLSSKDAEMEPVASLQSVSSRFSESSTRDREMPLR